MTKLRPYQIEAMNNVRKEWDNGHKNILLVAPTGAGKGTLVAFFAKENIGNTIVLVHRQELIFQLSCSLAAEGVKHRIIAPISVVRLCVKLHMEQFGVNFHDAQSGTALASVPTLVRRGVELTSFVKKVTLWINDEAHHCVKDNIWGKAIELFTNAKGLGLTATPVRSDGKGLGWDNDGYFHTIVVAETMRNLINQGYLTEYKFFCPPNNLHLENVRISDTTGDYSTPSLVAETKKSSITGDAIAHYLKLVNGKRAICFCASVELATETAQKFMDVGVVAHCISAKTPDDERFKLMAQFKRGDIKVITNDSIFGEGINIEGIECVILLKATASYGLFIQMVGRALRPIKGKDTAIILDHCGNVLRHLVPDAPRKWSLDRRDRKSKGIDPDVMPVRACPHCAAVYERIYKECPSCGYVAPPVARNAPELVDGDLHELDAETLAEMRKAIEHMNRTPEEVRAECEAKFQPLLGQLATVKRHKEDQEGQALLREAIAWWRGYREAEGEETSVSYRRFFHTYGVDVLTAQTLRSKESNALAERLLTDCRFLTTITEKE